MIPNHLAALMCSLLCLKLKNWTAGQPFMLSNVSSLCVLCYLMPSMCLPHSASRRTESSFYINFTSMMEKVMFCKTLPCIPDKKLQDRKRFVSELQWNHAGISNSVCRSDTWLSHLASQGWGSLPLHQFCHWKRCRRTAFCCGDVTASTEQRTDYSYHCMHSGC